MKLTICSNCQKCFECVKVKNERIYCDDCRNDSSIYINKDKYNMKKVFCWDNYSVFI